MFPLRSSCRHREGPVNDNGASKPEQTTESQQVPEGAATEGYEIRPKGTGWTQCCFQISYTREDV
jgi:hypothetical protein